MEATETTVEDGRRAPSSGAPLAPAVVAAEVALEAVAPLTVAAPTAVVLEAMAAAVVAVRGPRTEAVQQEQPQMAVVTRRHHPRGTRGSTKHLLAEVNSR